MRILQLCFILNSYCLYVFGQQATENLGKPLIDSSVLGKWPNIQSPAISNNGKYARYTITNRPIGANTLVILRTDRSWRKEAIVNDPWTSSLFSEDNRLFAFLSADTLRILQLGEEQTKLIAHVQSLKFPPSGSGKWMAYLMKEPSGTLTLKNLLTGAERNFSEVEDYSFDNNGKTLVIKKGASHALEWLDLPTGVSKTVWRSDTSKVISHNISGEGDQLVFLVQGQSASRSPSIWYFSKQMAQAAVKVNNRTPGIAEGMTVGGVPQFSKSGRWIFFKLIPKPAPIAQRVGGADVTVWNYKDIIIQPEQQRLLDQESILFMASIGTSLSEKKVLRIEGDDELVNTRPQAINGDFVVINDHESNMRPWWKFSPGPSFFLVSLKDGSRTLLKKESRSLRNFSFSPGGKYLVYYDLDQQQYFSCDLATRQIINITKLIPQRLSHKAFNAAMHTAVDNVAGWEKNDQSLLLYDNYDLWKVDPSGRNRPVCITDGFGAKHNIRLRLLDASTIYSEDDTLLITGFNMKNKYNGFFRKVGVTPGQPELLTMGPYTYYRVESQKDFGNCFDNGQRPLKAGGANYWLVKRQSATDAPNLFLTNDFRTYTAISGLHPQQRYNWITSELVTWKQLDGTFSDGILYKPENFDPQKKYPIIFNYYRQLSHTLYEFPYPEFTTSNINIPWFVSSGYLVFVPDINYTEKMTAIRSSYNAVVSAAQYLATLPFVDASKMGVQGHSWGGAETNYIITHSNIFAAAAEFAGVSDNISAYLTLVPAKTEEEHFEKYPHTEYSYANGKTLWEKKDEYLESNAILNVDRISTPLLITHNKHDNQIGYRQGIELYMALRRLSKMAWMLEYKNAGHAVLGDDAEDFTIRLTQFFDHYLKGKPAPIWMTRGVPAQLRGISTGLELDTVNACGDKCPVCNLGSKEKFNQRLLAK